MNISQLIKLLILTVFAGGLLAFFLLGGDQWISFEAVKNNRNALFDYTQANYWTMFGLALLIYTASTALSIPGAVILSLAIGFLFGRWTGTMMIVLAATTGATLVFLAARYLFAEAAKRRMGQTANKIMAGFNENALHYLLFLRLVPLFPFWLVNLVPAFTPITTRTYIIATAIGIIPGSFVFANLGQSLGQLDSLDQLVSVDTIGAFVLLGLFVLIPVVVKKLRPARSIPQFNQETERKNNAKE